MTIANMVQAEDVIWRQIGDRIVVIKDDGLSTHVLNKTAAFIWQICQKECNVDEVAAKLNERFEVSLEEARRDVIDIFTELNKAGIMQQRKSKITGGLR